MTLSPLLIFHIAAGGFGLASGTVALWVSKGSPVHRAAGNIFFISMMIMSLAGAYLAYFKPEMISVLNGLLTFYLVATSWATVKREAGKVGRFEWLSCLFVVLVCVGHFTFGLEAANTETGRKEGFPAAVFFVFGAVAGLSAILDLNMIYRGGVSGAERIVRHLWRMCFAMFIATTSFFLGQAQVFPDVIRDSQVLFVPVIVVILISGFWFIRVKFTRWYQPT